MSFLKYSTPGKADISIIEQTVNKILLFTVIQINSH